jgi:hypothetical protein
VVEMATGLAGTVVVILETDPKTLLVPPLATGRTPVTCEVKSILDEEGVTQLAAVPEEAVKTWLTVGGVVEMTTGFDGVVVVMLETEP